MGSKAKWTDESGDANTVIVIAAYIAPEAPRDGKIFVATRPDELCAGTALAAAALAVVADAVTAAPLDDAKSCDTILGYRIREWTMWETRLEKTPARGSRQ
jgi:hypothetical protein